MKEGGNSQPFLLPSWGFAIRASGENNFSTSNN
jgi:hypothetical protein